MSDGLLKELVDEVRGLRLQLTAQAVYEKPMTREQAAEYLGVNPSTLYKWARENRVAYTRFGEAGGSGMRFLKCDLDAFLARNRIRSMD